MEVGYKFDPQKDKLDEGDPSKWDPTLLCYVLKHSVWHSVLDQAVRTEISRLGIIRNNYFGHLHSMYVSTGDLKDVIQEVKKAFETIMDGKAEKNSVIGTLEKIETGKFFSQCYIPELKIFSLLTCMIL